MSDVDTSPDDKFLWREADLEIEPAAGASPADMIAKSDPDPYPYEE